MADNNRPTTKKASIVLAVLCVIFATVATILYKNHQIGSIGYSAPVVIGIVVAILSSPAPFSNACSTHYLQKAVLIFLLAVEFLTRQKPLPTA